MAAVVAVLGSAVTMTAQQKVESRDMTLVGSNDLQARSAYQPVIQKQGDRWIAYIGHHAGSMPNVLTGKLEDNGTSVVDVTNPRQPKYIAHIPGGGEERGPGQAQMVRTCTGADLPKADKSKVYLLRSLGSTGHEVWDVTTPEKPSRLTVVVNNMKETHKSFWECDTGIAYLVGGDPAWRTPRMIKIYDLSDPAHPVFIRDFGLVGQQPGSTMNPVPTEMHGPISLGAKANRVYIGYGTGRFGIVQIIDRKKLLEGPKEPTEANLLYPQIGRFDLPIDAGAHTALPLMHVMLPEFGKQNIPQVITNTAAATHDVRAEGITPPTTQGMRDFIVTVGETTGNECNEARQFVRILDATFESKMMGVSSWTVPESSGSFCTRGGRFGAHSTQENMTPIYYGKVLFVTFFNAGVRALDIRDPFNPKEIAYFIPPITAKTDKRCVGRGADERCKIAIQTNNVEVDDRGYVYIVDRANTGLHILELSGAARRVANFPTPATN
jgi:hypothetical protein